MAQNDNAARFRALLAELLMLDQADLDFGIYRIMNARRAEITRFLDEDLLPQIHEELRRSQTGDRAEVERELHTALELLRGLGVPEESSDKVRALRAKLADAMDVPHALREVFNHLYNFFSRYYQEGDFLSLRRYKRDVYALPYEGEELKLHWANADQYYIKTSEFFRDYSFTLADGRRVRLKLAAADTEQNNNKATGERERRFMLAGASDFLHVEEDELVISFVYQPDAEKRKQADINRGTVRAIFDALGAGTPPAPAKAAQKGRKKQGVAEAAAATAGGAVNTALLAWAKALMQPVGTDGNPERTTLEKHLNDYTAKNSFDYFIHKDLSGFLRRELDFYIKNEVMFLDDIERESAPRVENYLAVVRAIRRVGLKLIEFLASLEDFQKRLWLKKKFVVETHWCVTLDRVPEEFYGEVAANERQRAEWVRLFAVDEIDGNLHDAAYSEPLTAEFLRSQPHLVLDTSLFERDFTERLLATFDDLEGQTDGVLIESENFQALNLLQARYREQVKCIYIDPPYNTGNDDFIYKDSYKHSSWLAMMYDRLTAGWNILAKDGAFFASIGEDEQATLKTLLNHSSGAENLLGTLVWKARVKPVNIGEAKYRPQNETEYVLAYERSKGAARFQPLITGSVRTYPHALNGRPYRLATILKSNRGVNYRSTMTFEINGYTPPEDQRWQGGEETIQQLFDDGYIEFRDGVPFRRYFEDEEGAEHDPFYCFMDSEWSGTSEEGKAELNRILGNRHGFDTVKPTRLLKTLISSCATNADHVVDYFAGSGTTGHAILSLNRDNDLKLKFILIETAEYFRWLLKPRVLKVIYSRDWREGKPVARVGSSCLVKILRLESYEDTLNNLTVSRTSQQTDLLALHDVFREQYTLRYLFERETAQSASLLNLALFENPFDYRLDVSAPGSSAARVSTPVDLVETFNYLLGLRVARRYTREGFRVVEGAGADGSRTLIIWRNAREQDNGALNRFFTKQGYGARGFAVVYANGDHTLGMARGDGETWQDRMIEMDFKRLMFEEAA